MTANPRDVVWEGDEVTLGRWTVVLMPGLDARARRGERTACSLTVDQDDCESWSSVMSTVRRCRRAAMRGQRRNHEVGDDVRASPVGVEFASTALKTAGGSLRERFRRLALKNALVKR